MKTKKFSKFLSLLLALVLVVGMLPATAMAASASVADDVELAAALAGAADGDTITLTGDITGGVSYMGEPGKTVTIDGGNHKITADDGGSSWSTALTLSGGGTVILKNITLQGNTDSRSCGLYINQGSAINVQSVGTVSAIGGDNATDDSFGLYHYGSGTVRISTAQGGSGSTGSGSCGIRNHGTGTVYADTATGGTAGSSIGVDNVVTGTVNVGNVLGGEALTGSYGVYNRAGGVVNAVSAVGGNANGGTAWSYGVWNGGSGTVNVGTATSGAAYESYGVFNNSGGTVNANAASGGSHTMNVYESWGVYNNAGGTINVTTAAGGIATGSSCGAENSNGASGSINVKTATSSTNALSDHQDTVGDNVHTGSSVATLTLNKGTGASCVLDFITVAGTGDTTVGALPSVYKDDEYSDDWYTDSAGTEEFDGTATATTELYSEFSITPGGPGAFLFAVSDGQRPAALYSSLEAAIKGAADGDTIWLADSEVEVTEAVTIPEGKNLTLDLGGSTLTILPVLSHSTLTVNGGLTVKDGSLTVVGGGDAPAVVVSGGSLSLGDEGEIEVSGTANGLSVTGGGDATVTSVWTRVEGGAAVSARGYADNHASYAKIVENVGKSGVGGTVSADETYGAIAKDGAQIEVGGGIALGVLGVAGEGPCVAARAIGGYHVGGETADVFSRVHVTGSVSAKSQNGTAYGALAVDGGQVVVEGDAEATGVGSLEGDGSMGAAAAAAADLGSTVFIDGGVTATGLYGVYGCYATDGGRVQVTGGCAASGLFVYGAFAYASNSFAYVGGDTEVKANSQGGTEALQANGGYAVGGGTVELMGNLSVLSDAAGWGIVADGKGSNAAAYRQIIYAGKLKEHTAGAAAINGGAAWVNGYFMVLPAKILIDDNLSPYALIVPEGHNDPYNLPAYRHYIDDGAFDPSTSSVVHVIRLGSILGYVEDAEGNPLNGVTVSAYSDWLSDDTDSMGSFSINPMPIFSDEVDVVAHVAPHVDRVVFDIFLAEGAGTEVDFTNEAGFITTIDSSLSNNTATFGLTGTGAVSSNDGVLQAELDSGILYLTSVGAGSATVTLTDASGHAATIAVTVDTHGYLTIGTITKYSGSSSNPPTGGGATTPPPTTTVSGTTATTTVTPTVSGGKATGSVTADQMSDALKKARAAAGTSGTPNVTIQVSGASGASSVGMTIPHTSLQAFISGGVGALTVSGPTGSVSFDTAALGTISDASGDVTVTIARTDSAALSDAARALVGSHPVFTFGVTSGGSAITQFGGDVTVSVPYTLAAGEDPNAIVIYYIAADGTPTLVQDARYDAATGTVVFTTTHFSTYAVGYNKVGFTDVTLGAWYHDAVTFLAARGITSGTTATTFGPDDTLTRGQFITMLLRAYGVSAAANGAGNFTDAGNTYYTGYLAAAKKLGITTGVGNNKFAPDQAITRQEMFTLLYNALKVLDKLPSGTSGKTLADFTDAGSIASWAADAMTALVKAGTVTGSGGKISPTDTTTRAEMAQVLFNLLKK